jgi:hypothetical protein
LKTRQNSVQPFLYFSRRELAVENYSWDKGIADFWAYYLRTRHFCDPELIAVLCHSTYMDSNENSTQDYHISMELTDFGFHAISKNVF